MAGSRLFTDPVERDGEDRLPIRRQLVPIEGPGAASADYSVRLTSKGDVIVARIAMIGTRGVPARYGGFEAAVEEVGQRLAARGHDVVVYCRNDGQRIRTH